MINANALLLITALGATGDIDLREVDSAGVRVLRDYRGQPDRWGIFESCEVNLPGYVRGVYYASPWWPAGGNRGRAFAFERLSDLRQPGAEFGPKRGQSRTADGGFFLILERTDGDYLAVLPVGGPTVYSWFDISPIGDKLLLNLGHWGTDPIDGEDVPLFAWSCSDNPYEAAHGAWKAARQCPQSKGSFRLRSEKAYPEPFKYLGWCSWEFYRASDEAKDYPGLCSDSISRMMNDFRKLGKPIRWMLIDNGHFNSSTDFSPKEKGWPDGYRPMAEACRDDGVRWIGIWYAFMGGGKHPFRGVDSLPENVRHHMMTVGGAGLPKPRPESHRFFYEYLYSFAKSDGLDFLKIDFSTRPLCHYAGREVVDIDQGRIDVSQGKGIGNPYQAQAAMFRALEEVSNDQFGGIIHCNWHSTANLFNLQHGVVGRSSEDYKPGNLKRGKSHHFYSYAAMPWMGQVAWGDHDMFHSCDEKHGRLMAAAKSLSGAPVYVSDGPKECNMEAIGPLCFADGRIIRPLAPGTPVYDDIFFQPNKGNAYRVTAPLPNRIAMFSGANIEGQPGNVTAAFQPEMYAQSSGLIQPYPGEWGMPKEGLVYFDVYAQKGGVFSQPIRFELAEFSDCLLQVSPVENGWALIGRTDKYLCGAAVELVESSKNELVLNLPEAGPVAVYTARVKPKSDGVEFTDLGNGIYQANLPAGVVNITR